MLGRVGEEQETGVMDAEEGENFKNYETANSIVQKLQKCSEEWRLKIGHWFW